jgi:hypothetical protein
MVLGPLGNNKGSKKNGGAIMKNLFISIVAVLIGGFFASSVVADDKHDHNTLVKFKGGIGVHPVSNVSGTQNANLSFPDVTRNIVQGVNPAGQLWVIRNLEARVKTNGDIKAEGKGLVLAGGNNIGRATGQSVFATLFCGTTTVTEHSTTATGVALTIDGDFKIDDVLMPIPPADCASPVLLIRNAMGGTWFAAGILDLDDHDRR